MKKYTFYFICFLMAVAVTSCKKEKEEDSFLKGQMTDFHGQKAYIDGSNYSCFRQGETIFVNGRNNCTVSALSNSDRTCTISGAEEASGYYAFYPANMISATDISSGFSNATVTLPRVQQYAEENGHQVIDNPMAGYLANSSGIIVFNNLCALLKVNVTSNWTLDSIQVTMKGTDLWGTGSVDASDANNTSNWKIVMGNGATHDTKYETVSLKFPNSISTGNGMSFYIMVPNNTVTADNEAVKVHFYGKFKQVAVHKNHSMVVSQSQQVVHNKIITLNTFSLIEPGVGVFTVNAQGKKVTFSQRQLINVGNKGNYTVDGLSYVGISGNDRHFFNYGDYANYIICHNIDGTNPYPSGTWRTPTESEWNYILFNRSTPSGKRFAKTSVEYHRGIIIFPDDWVYNSSSSPHNKLTNINNANASYDGQISSSEWINTFEREGCIFIRGFDNSAQAGTNSPDPGPQRNEADGYYATATSGRCLRFTNNSLAFINVGSYKVNVRLVHDLN